MMVIVLDVKERLRREIEDRVIKLKELLKDLDLFYDVEVEVDWTDYTINLIIPIKQRGIRASIGFSYDTYEDYLDWGAHVEECEEYSKDYCIGYEDGLFDATYLLHDLFERVGVKELMREIAIRLDKLRELEEEEEEEEELVEA